MKGFWAVFLRELASLFVTPIAWILMVSFLVIEGAHFYLIVAHYATTFDPSVDDGPVQAFFGEAIYLPLVLFCPAITMRLFAEERRSGTIETLLTAPVGTAGVVLGKYAAALATYAAMWLPTVLYVLVLRSTVSLDWHVVAAGYAGVLLIGAGYLAVGTLMSALTSSQLVAVVLSALVIVGLFMLGFAELAVDRGTTHDVAAYVAVWNQMSELARGIVDSRRLVYDATVIALPLFFTVRVVDSWRWA